jgi:phosphoglycerate dehydrogenase-like enzyme
MDDTIEVLVTVGFSDDQLAQIEKISPRLHVTQILAKNVSDISDDIWINTKVLYTDIVIPPPEKVPSLRWIQFHWAGINQSLSNPIMQKPGILATTLSGATASQVAEFVVMMLLVLGHRLPQLMAYQKQGKWLSDKNERVRLLELRNSTVGIVGYGSIGRQIANLLQPYGANILAAKQNAMRVEDQGFMPAGLGDPNGDLALRIYPGKALKAMLKESDYIIVCVPKTPQTINMISAEEFAVIKPTAFLIDVSRGEVVDQAALIEALKTQNLAGAALDVFPEEPLPPDNPLWELPNVIITPHIAGESGTAYYNDRALEIFSTNMERYLSGEPLLNLISFSRGY